MGNGTISTQLKVWLGSGGSAESYVLAPSSIPVVTNKWNFFALVRDGANVLLYIGNSGGFGSGTGAYAYRLDTDEVTTQVWQIGQYYTAGSHTSDAYHKDYLFLQEASSNDELENMYKKNMSAYIDKLRISYEIQEV